MLETLQQSLSRSFIEELFRNLNKLGMNNDQIISAVQQWAKEGN